jgi:hypothetical protein
MTASRDLDHYDEQIEADARAVMAERDAAQSAKHTAEGLVYNDLGFLDRKATDAKRSELGLPAWEPRG